MGVVSGGVAQKGDTREKNRNRADEVLTQEKCIKKCAKKAFLQNRIEFVKGNQEHDNLKYKNM